MDFEAGGDGAQLLKAMPEGEAGAAEKLLRLVYAAVHWLAKAGRRRERRKEALPV